MSPKRFFYILCGLLGIILVVGGLSYYYATINLSQTTAQLSQRLADEEVADENLASLQNLNKQYKHLAPELQAINQALPDEKKISQIALELHDIASNSGMSLDSLTFAASTKPGPTSQTVAAGSSLAIPITFQLVGSYNQLQAFLQRQERLKRYTSVTSLDISTSDSGSLAFNITLDAYVKP